MLETKRVEAYIYKECNIGKAADQLPWLQNSNKIGLGYNPIIGSPICFTGDCLIDGFRRPVVQLKFTSSEKGSCTNQIIPDYVNLDCLPS